VHGRRYLSEPGQFVIANHPTLIDVVFLVACIPNAVCVVKDTLLRSFGVGLLLRGAGYVGNAEDPQASLDACVDAMRDGATLVMFPEGSRSVPGVPSRLRRGAAYVALAAQKELTPVHISCTPSSLTKSERWYDIPHRRMHFVISVGHRIPVPKDAASHRVTAKVITERARLSLLQENPVYD
jgi:1-acyl-sn-glycerol-3-phosphate acyltransferase